MFEIGKFYMHSTGEMMAILGRLPTTMYGDCLIAEVAGKYNHSIKAIGSDVDSAANWVEVTQEEWLANFS